MRIVRTVGQAFDVCHQLTLQQQSEDKEEEEEGKVEESDTVPGCSSKHTHTHICPSSNQKDPEQKHWQQSSSLVEPIVLFSRQQRRGSR